MHEPAATGATLWGFDDSGTPCRWRDDCKVSLAGGDGWRRWSASAQLTRCDDGGQADLAVICTVEELVVDAGV